LHEHLMVSGSRQDRPVHPAEAVGHRATHPGEDHIRLLWISAGEQA
jgi:hypothetical protein